MGVNELTPRARACHELPLKVTTNGVPARTSRAPLGYGHRTTALPAWPEPLQTFNGPKKPPNPSVPEAAGMPTRLAATPSRWRGWLLRRSECLQPQMQKLDPKPNTSLSPPEDCNEACNTNCLEQCLGIHQPFRWIPIQVRELEDDYFRGVYVNSLSLSFRLGQDIAWKRLDVDTSKCVCEGMVSCCWIQSNIVMCRGLVVRTQSTPYAGVIAQLPPDMRPSSAMTFATLCRQPDNLLSLAALSVTREGKIVGNLQPGCTLDLSGIRFATQGGFPLSEGIQLFSFKVGTQRFGILQGRTSTKFFQVVAQRALASLPADFTPVERLAFAIPGTRSGGFHLLHLVPSSHGGQLQWSDAVWNRDELEISGIIFEMLSDVSCIPSTLISNWSEARREIVLMDFHKLLMSRYGSLNVAWQEAVDVDDYGYVDFAQFSQSCRRLQYCGNVCRLWSMLDPNNTGTVSFEALLGRSKFNA